MKILALLLLSMNLYAGKSLIGSYAEYKFKADQFSGKLRVEITAYDEVKDTYTQVTTTTQNGNQNTSTETIQSIDVNTQDENLAILINCETQLGGRLRNIRVSAGTFETCILEEDDGGSEQTNNEKTKIYFANVPFGYIKMKSPAQTVELTKYSF